VVRRKSVLLKPKDFTIREFADIYLEEYCKVRDTRPDFKEETLKVIKNIVGHVKVTEFTAAHAAFFEKERKKSVAGPTVNRGLAVLSHMFTFALKTKGLIQIHPMTRYGRIPEDEKALRVMDLEEERNLVNAVLAKNHVIGCSSRLRWFFGCSPQSTVTPRIFLFFMSEAAGIGSRPFTMSYPHGRSSDVA